MSRYMTLSVLAAALLVGSIAQTAHARGGFYVGGPSFGFGYGNRGYGGYGNRSGYYGGGYNRGYGYTPRYGYNRGYYGGGYRSYGGSYWGYGTGYGGAGYYPNYGAYSYYGW